jgi:acetyltransferase-like isoleucine patch superfamily enzyme
MPFDAPRAALRHSRSALRQWLRVPPGLRVVNFIFQHVLRINAGAPCAVNFTSRVIRPESITIGAGVSRSFAVSGGCYFQAANGISIGAGTIFGPGVRVVSANHDLSHSGRWKPAVPITIGKNCWLGAGSIILPGVSIGDGSIVGAGAVVVRDVPARCVVVGNPARVIGNTEVDSQASVPYAEE